MVKDNQVRMLMRLIHKEETLETAAAKAGMNEKTPDQAHYRVSARWYTTEGSPRRVLL